MRRALIACFAVLLAGAAQAATIKVLCDGPLAPALPAVGEAFKKKTKHQVDFAFAPSPVIHKRIIDGESADVVIVQPNFLAELAAKGKVDPGDHPAFGRIGIGLAARADAPTRDIKTADALRQVLKRADSIVFNNVASGDEFAKVLERTGIAAEVKTKVIRTDPAQTFERILAGSGDDLSAGTITLIRADKRLKLIGPLPAELQSYLYYAAVPMTGTPNMKAAIEFVRFLFTKPVKAQLAAAGVE
ncbi:MAG: substrate-binding domain-containing protein [Xanthobacteraceae bacterium]